MTRQSRWFGLVWVRRLSPIVASNLSRIAFYICNDGGICHRNFPGSSEAFPSSFCYAGQRCLGTFVTYQDVQHDHSLLRSIQFLDYQRSRSLFLQKRISYHWEARKAGGFFLPEPWHHRQCKRSHMGHSHQTHSLDQNAEHSHPEDAGDAGERVSRWGLWADVSLSVIKGVAGYISGSTAVLADAAHSVSDVVLSGIALWFIKAARAPKDEKHPYGHGKFETIGALGISSVLLFTGGGIAWHAVEVLQVLMASSGVEYSSALHSAAYDHSLFRIDENQYGHMQDDGGHHHGIDMEHLGVALSATVVSIAVKEGLYWVTKRVGEDHGSELLKANAWHHRSDAISSIVALIGVGGAISGLPILDPVAGLFVSGMVIKMGLQTGYQSLQELVDSGISDSVLYPFQKTAMQINGVKGCHQLRGRRAGSSIYLDVHIEVDPYLTVSAAHVIGETVREEIQKCHPSIIETFIHIEPEGVHFSKGLQNVMDKHAGKAQRVEVGADWFQQPEVEKVVCDLIGSELSQIVTFTHVKCRHVGDGLYVDVEVCMDPQIVIRDAMHYASDVKRKILKALPNISAVNIQLRLINQSGMEER